MQITIMQNVMIKRRKDTSRCIKKTFNSNIIPHKGDYIQDSVWKDDYEQEVLGVTIDYNKDECYVFLRPLEFRSLDNKNTDENILTEFIQMAELHGWSEDI